MGLHRLRRGVDDEARREASAETHFRGKNQTRLRRFREVPRTRHERLLPHGEPPVVTTDANALHVPSTLVAQLSVASCALIGTTSSRSPRIGGVQRHDRVASLRGELESVASLSFASMRVSRT